MGLGVAGLGAGAFALPPAAKSPVNEGPLKSLRETAAAAGLMFGASVANEVLSDAGYRQLYLDHAAILTSDLALKMLILRPDAGAPRYAEADALVGFAQEHGMLFRGHCLIWNENNPDWMKTLDRTQIAALLDRHVEETVHRYKGRMHSWDVVNEPFWPEHGAAGGYRKGPWFNALGPDYIARALRRAASADNTAKLVINEAFTERGDELGKAVRAGMLRLIDDLHDHGAPLHAIGLEAHLQPQIASDDEGFVRFLEAVAARGLDIYITELDIDDEHLPRDPATRDAAAASRVGAFLRATLSVRAVKIVECWQLSDRYSWYADPSMRRLRPAGDPPARPLPFDGDFRSKPMARAIASAFRDRARA